jgi:hypothetical protein
MTKFNLKEAIAKNKATFFSSLNEETENIERNYEDALKAAKELSDENKSPFHVNLIGGQYNSKDGGSKYYVSSQFDPKSTMITFENGEEVDKISSKMKMSELKAKIKEMVLAEMNLDIQDTTSEYDFLAEETEFVNTKPDRINSFVRELDKLVDEYHAELYLNDDLFSALEMVVKAAKEEAMNLNEADKEDTEIEDTEVEMDGIEDIDVDTTGEVNPDVKAVQDALTQAQAAAQRIGDEKLTDQIGNTITFFTRAHVVDRGAVAESGPIEERTNLGSELDEMLSVLEYDTAEEFFADNPGAVDELVTWILSVPEYRQKLKDLDTKDMNESMFPLFKRIM